jgi:hypothetical protein
MWVAWAIFVVGGVAAAYVYWRIRPLYKALGKNLIDSMPRFRRHDLEQVRSALEHHAVLAKHKKAAALDLWLAPLVTATVAAFAWGIANGRATAWVPVALAIVAGLGDQVENHFIRRILAAPHRPVPQGEVTALAIATSVKFGGYILALVVPFVVVAIG